MLTRLLPVARLSGNAIRFQAARCMGYGASDLKTHREIAIENKMTLDDLPTPEGSWLEHYQQRQKSYNIQLVASSVILVVTLYVGWQSGALYLNPMPDYKKITINWDKPDIPPVEVEE